VTQQSVRISLAEAFAAVMHQHEDEQGVPPEHRLGTPLGRDPPMYPPRIPAEGARFAARFSAGGQPTREKKREAIRPPNVPMLPDAEQLHFLLEDHREAGDTSEAERRLCASHLWLVQVLRTGRVTAWADASILRPTGIVRLRPAESLPVEKDHWNHFNIDYRCSRLQSQDGDLFEAIHNHRRILGELVLDDAALDEAQFLAALQDPRGVGVTARLHRSSNADHDTWTIHWNESNWRLDVPHRQALKRGMRIIALLLRHPGQVISWHLLQGLARNPPRARDKAEGLAASTKRLHSTIGPLSQQVFFQKEELKAVEKDTSKAVDEFEGDTDNVAENHFRIHNERVRAEVNLAIKIALEEIKKSNRHSGHYASKSIESFLSRRPMGCVYDSDDNTVSWNVSMENECL
jgi:hypothetical protein